MEVNHTPHVNGTEFLKCPVNSYKAPINDLIGDGQCQKVDDTNLVLKNINLNPECLTLKDLIDGLYRIFESDRVNIEEVYALMSAYKSNPAEWVKFAKFDRYKYTRNLVDAGNDKFNLMILCWGEGHASTIHDHSNSHCFMKMLAGSLCEMRYKWPEEEIREDVSRGMEEISRSMLATNEVCYMNDSLGLHRVENLSYTDCAVSLHLYSPPFSKCKTFDLRTGRCIVAPVTFWSIKGERCNKKSRPKRDKTTVSSDSEDLSSSS